MNEYYCKAPHEMPQHRFLGANEVIVSQLARFMGIPTRPLEIIDWAEHLYVGLQVLPNDRKLTGNLTPEILARLSNPDVLYGLVVLDGWTINQDRHELNWLGGVLGNGAAWFLANDHDMCLLAPGVEPNHLEAMSTQPITGQIVRSPAIAATITSPFLLRGAIERAQSIPEADLWRVVGSVPPAWLDEAGRALMVAFLTSRCRILGNLFADCLALFPNLEHL
jgi:hypothetical protein